MVSEVPVPMADEVNVVAEKAGSRSIPKKKNHGRIPKKIHKAEREKLKRDHLNELFLELGNALESARQSNGKASILIDASRLLRELLSQVECLKKENATLLSESHYVTIEKNELKDENSVLESEIEKLQTELQDRAHSKTTWDAAPIQSQQENSRSQVPDDCLTMPVVDPTLQPPPVVGPVFVIPLPRELQGYPDAETAHAPSMPTSNVSRPHARYPTQSDLWPSHLLAKQPTTQENQLSSRTSTSDDRGEQISDGL